MAKALVKWVTVASILVAALLLFRRDPEAVTRARAEAARITAERDSIRRVVDSTVVEQANLRHERDRHAQAAAALRDSVAALERARVEAQRSVRSLRTTDSLGVRFAEAFPELGTEHWGITTLPLTDDTLGLEVLLVPAWFGETFLIDHQNAESWRAQKDRLLAVDSLQLHVAQLQDSITTLEAEKARAYEAGYREAYASYQELNARYVAELSRPKFSLGSTVGLCVGAAGAGFLLGEVIRE